MSGEAAAGRASGEAAAGRASAEADLRQRAREKVLRWFRAALVFVGLLPWALPFARARLPIGDVGVGVDLAFFAMCHRRAARTLVLDGVLMPLCSRCAGIFLGVALGAVIGRPILEIRAWRWAFAGACALMVADVVTQDLGLHPVWHETRLITGVLVGYGMVIGFLSALARDRSAAAEAGASASS